jgi:hypothetical protein
VLHCESFRRDLHVFHLVVVHVLQHRWLTATSRIIRWTPSERASWVMPVGHGDVQTKRSRRRGLCSLNTWHAHVMHVICSRSSLVVEDSRPCTNVRIVQSCVLLIGSFPSTRSSRPDYSLSKSICFSSLVVTHATITATKSNSQILIVKVLGGYIQSQTSNLRPNRSQSPFPDTPRETPKYVLLIAKISISPFIGSLSSLEDFQITHHKSHITIHKSQVSAQCKRLTYTRH